MPGADPTQPAGDFPDRLAASVANWKRKLLDLTRRNRALNFKPTKVSTIAIVDEHPAEVFRHLYLEEKAMRFKADPTKRDPPKKKGESQPALVTDGEGEPLDFHSESEDALEYVPYDPSSVDERHRDDWLQTRLSPESLDHSLRRLEELARTSIEEQGVNTLFVSLGMLQYRESRDSETWFRAPLVLLPVQLARKSARSGFSLTVADDDALVNPALAEHLRLNYGISLPELPDSETISDTYDFQHFLKAAADAVADQPEWAVHTDMFLAIFSFQKLVMFKDLEANQEAIGLHRLIQQLLLRVGSAVHGLPEDIRRLTIDEAFTPETSHQVVDADSSQMRAAAAVAKGHDIVIEGPPGTGKSQTITNLVAQALAAGKSVLFVAEKMAALDVVHRRLAEARLSEFCLELHSSKANKRAVMKELSAALDASLLPVAGNATASKRLPEVRTTLADYVRAVHEPHGALAMSPYAAAGELGRYLDAPKVRLAADIDGVTREQLGAADRALADLAVHAAAIGNPGEHPWRDTGRTLYTEDDLELVASLCRDIDARVRALVADAATAAPQFGIDVPATLADLEALAELADVLGASPGVAPEILQNAAWNSPPPDATALIATGRKRNQLRASASAKFTDTVFDADHAVDIAYVEQKSSGVLSFLAVLDSRYRAIKKRWVAYRQTGYSASIVEQAHDLKVVDQAAALGRELDASEQIARPLFGGLWRGAASDWDRLQAYVDFVVRYRRLAIERSLGARTAEVASQAAPDVSGLRTLATSATALRSRLAELRTMVMWPEGYLENEPLAEIGTRLRALAGSLGKAPAWAAFEASRQRAVQTVAGEVVPAAMTGQVAFDQLSRVFTRAFYMKWMSAAITAREPLRGFDTLTHEALIHEFQDLDKRILRENQGALIGTLRDRAQQNLRQPEAAASLPKLRREMVKQRRHSPLRKTLRECGAAIRAIKPCLMMSPLTVAQFLDGRTPTFDLVIFDEASQLPTEDAIGAVIRGRQLVVVGDPKQLPPTNFFAVSTGSVQAPLAEDGSPLYEDTESVLEEFMGAAVPMSRLKWHYRSAHESLINFSNVNFYDADLHTFLSVLTDTDASGLQFHFVEGGVYEGKGVNLVEARRIADEVVAFAKFQLQRKALGERTLSLGVGTLNLRQQLAILDELEVRRRDDPGIEPFFDRSADEPFFVKNLENIQGDERDAIFLSITYGRSPDGRIRYNFGPLNRENGWRRLNVLVTRARRQMKVFSSMRDHDINPAGATSDGPRLLREFLAYAEHRRLGGAGVTAAADAESPFERDVASELVKRGIKIEQQVGVCGYRVDIGVLDPELPGRFVCGIECDGVAYHSMETVRDRDRLRQQVLEDRGWIIHRVWSTDWFKDRQGQIDRLVTLIGESRQQVRSEEDRRMEERRAAAASTREATGPEPPVAASRYSRPVLSDYVICQDPGGPISGELLAAGPQLLAEIVARVVNIEGPIHETDLIARVAGFWGTKAGSRIQEAIRSAARVAERSGTIQNRGAFYWRKDGACEPRSRAETGIPGDRIAPEEYAQVVRRVLSDGAAFPRAGLITEVRAALGYSRTGPILEQAIGSVIDQMLADGMLGEGSGGIVLRRPA